MHIYHTICNLPVLMMPGSLSPFNGKRLIVPPSPQYKNPLTSSTAVAKDSTTMKQTTNDQLKVLYIPYSIFYIIYYVLRIMYYVLYIIHYNI